MSLTAVCHALPTVEQFEGQVLGPPQRVGVACLAVDPTREHIFATGGQDSKGVPVIPVVSLRPRLAFKSP